MSPAGLQGTFDSLKNQTTVNNDIDAETFCVQENGMSSTSRNIPAILNALTLPALDLRGERLKMGRRIAPRRTDPVKHSCQQAKSQPTLPDRRRI